MKNQTKEFIQKRDKMRHHLIMTRIGAKNHTYQKLMGQMSNGKYNPPLNESEIEDITKGVTNVISVCNDFLEELKKKD